MTISIDLVVPIKYRVYQEGYRPFLFDLTKYSPQTGWGGQFCVWPMEIIGVTASLFFQLWKRCGEHHYCCLYKDKQSAPQCIAAEPMYTIPPDALCWTVAQWHPDKDESEDAWHNCFVSSGSPLCPKFRRRQKHRMFFLFVTNRMSGGVKGAFHHLKLLKFTKFSWKRAWRT